jgi:hypothetical protein
VGNADWRPYWDNGRWIYTDDGWYWGSDYPWGWAAFHYGRWHLHPHYGWIWYPGREWGPAWVTWRSGGSYCGWAPLPPHSHFDSVSGHYFYRGVAVEASFDFGLSFGHFNFCYTRQMGDRSRSRFHNEREVRNIYNQTTVINNYTVIRDGRDHETRIVNHGIEPNRIVAQGGRPVERVQIQDRQSPRNGRSPESVDLKSKTLTVYRPKLAEERPATRGTAAPGVARPSPESRRPGVTPSPLNSSQPGSPAGGRTGTPAVDRDLNRPAPASAPGRGVPSPVSPTPGPSKPAVRNPNPTLAPSTPANPVARPPTRIQERPASGGSSPAPVSPAPSPARPAVKNPNQTFAPLAPANSGATSPARMLERPVAAPRQTITPPARAPARAVPTAPSRSEGVPTTSSRSGARDNR